MATYLLIEFDEDDSADRMRTQIDAATTAGKRFRLVGMYRKPRIWCTCVPDKTQMLKRIVRGPKFGWWVCRECKRARLGPHSLRNLLESLPDTPTTRGIDYLESIPRERSWGVGASDLNIFVKPR